MANKTLSYIENAVEMTAQDVYSKLVNGHEFPVVSVSVNGADVPFAIDPSVLRNLAGRTVYSASDETQLAIALHQALVPARKASIALLRDPGVWTWIGLSELREYVLVRWCGATPASMLPTSPDKCSYFLTGDALVRQARCAVRRLWIAANASWSAKSDYTAVAGNLALTDLYTGVFERMLGLDAELACALTTELHKPSYKEDDRRRVLIGVGARLSTVALECLDAGQKSQLIKEVIADMSANPTTLVKV